MKVAKVMILVVLFTQCNGIKNYKLGTSDSFPHFNIQLIDSVSVLNTKSILQGSHVVLFIFDTDCEYCRSEFKSLVANQDQFKDAHIYMITYSSFEKMKIFYDEFKIGQLKNFTIGRDTSLFTLKYYNLDAVPFTVIYDKEHQLVNSFNRRVDADVILNEIRN